MRRLDVRWICATSNRIVRRVLPVWFVVTSGLLLFQHFVLFPGDILGIDARIYYRGAEAWLAGQDPWDQVIYLRTPSQSYPSHFTGLPPTVLAVAPWTILPESVVVAIWLGLSVFAAILMVRRLGLPMYYLAFPPLVQGVLAANPHIVLLTLVISNRSRLSAIAPLVKIYMVAPLVGEQRWRTIALVAGALLVSVAAAPSLWLAYLGKARFISERILVESNAGYSSYTLPLLLIPTVVALMVIGVVNLRLAGWLAVPAAWPATQWFYSTMALPVIRPWMGLLLAADAKLAPAVVVWVVAVRHLPAARQRVKQVWRRLVDRGNRSSDESSL